MPFSARNRLGRGFESRQRGQTNHKRVKMLTLLIILMVECLLESFGLVSGRQLLRPGMNIIKPFCSTQLLMGPEIWRHFDALLTANNQQLIGAE